MTTASSTTLSAINIHFCPSLCFLDISPCFTNVCVTMWVLSSQCHSCRFSHLFGSLQSIKKTAARLLTGTRRCNNILTVLTRLYWLASATPRRVQAGRLGIQVTARSNPTIGPSLLPVRWPGTHCLTASEIRLCQPALSDVIWRLFFSPFTSVPAH